jgi:aspartate-semialdehyde dehydrogenase
MDPDVPILLPEVNSEHLSILETQRIRRGFHSGCIVTNSNCSTMTLCLALAPLARDFGLEQVLVTTMQAVSGAGYPGVPSLDIVGNVIPYIADEETKIETESAKILGSVKSGAFVSHPVRVSATTTRVPVIDGHTEIVHVKLTKRTSCEEVCHSLAHFRSVPQELGLPSAPERPVILLSESDRPQPRLDVNRERGMASIVGRVRECALFDYKFVVLGHNTIRGAAGCAILNAELLKVYKLI